LSLSSTAIINETLYQCIGRYLAGESKGGEAEAFKEVIGSDTDLREAMSEIRKLWDTKTENHVIWDFESSWKELEKKLSSNNPQ
jgi:hypothetical protein